MSRDLRALFEPRSVAVLGASNDPLKWGHWLARGALKGEHRRSVYLVNRNGGEILGRRAFRSFAELPEPPELVAVAVPSAGFEEAVVGALEAGAKALVGISAGFGELGHDGRAREQAVAERVREAGAVLLGPNCLGVFDARAELELASNEFPDGAIGLISQSGNLAIELGLLARDVGLGFSRFASLGNQADVDAAELVHAFAEHEPTRLIAIYCEDFRDGRAFAEAAHAAVAGGKPVLLLTVGGSEAATRAARSHTGALVSDTRAVDAACRAAGIDRVSSPKELVDLAQALLARRSLRGRRVAVAGDGGGHGALAADLAASSRLELPLLSANLSEKLAACLPATASTRNPVDLAGGGEQDISCFGRVVDILLASDEIDAVLLTGYFGGYSQYSPEYEAEEVDAAQAMLRGARESPNALVIHTMYWDSAPARVLRAGGVPVYREVEAGIAALARLADRADLGGLGVPPLPEPVQEPPVGSDYRSARELLAEAGLEFVEARSVRSADEAAAAAAELGYPVVLKAIGALHKSDAGGVVVGIRDEEELALAFARMTTALEPEGYSVERMAPLADGVEVIIGVRRDRRFGPVALIGLGGLHAEVLDDVAVALAPLEETQAEMLLRSLRGAPFLTGARGRPAVDLRAAARAAAALSRLAAARPEIREVEVNPLLVTPDGGWALDARIVRVDAGDDRETRDAADARGAAHAGDGGAGAR